MASAGACIYNAIFFTYALVLTRFYGVPDANVGYYIFPFALATSRAVVLGGLFDSSAGAR